MVMKFHTDHGDYVELTHTHVQAFLAKMTTDDTLLSNPGPGYSTCAVYPELDPSSFCRRPSRDTDKAFKEAKRLLRLEAPHTFIEVEDDIRWPEYETRKGDTDDFLEDLSDGEEKAEAEAVQLAAASPSHHPEEEPPRTRLHCIDCNKWPCDAPNGSELEKPKFRLLVSAEPEAFSR